MNPDTHGRPHQPHYALSASPTQSQPVVLVTGSTSGIGAAIARRMSQDGYAVIVHSRCSTDAGYALVSEIGVARYVRADLAFEAERVRLIKEAVAAGSARRSGQQCRDKPRSPAC